MIRNVLRYLLTLVFFWLSYLQIMEIRINGQLRFQSGQQLTGWSMYAIALLSAILATYVIMAMVRKKL